MCRSALIEWTAGTAKSKSGTATPFIRANGAKSREFASEQTPPENPMFKGAELVKLGRDAVLVANIFVLTAGGREQQQIVKITRLAVD